MKKLVFVLVAILTVNTVFSNNIEQKDWTLHLSNNTQCTDIYFEFENKTDFYSFLSNLKQDMILDYDNDDECEVTVEVTVGAASASFTMKGDCEGFSERLAVRVAEVSASLRASAIQAVDTIESSSMWDDLADWWNGIWD